MSALTSSPSPAASPAHAFHIQPSPTSRVERAFKTPPSSSSSRPPSRAGTSRQGLGGGGTYTTSSGLSIASSSPRNRPESAFNAQATSQLPSTSALKDPKYTPVVSGVESGLQSSYVSTGTQYSPEGLPPTAQAGAGTGAAAKAGKVQDKLPNLPGTPGSAGKKRPRSSPQMSAVALGGGSATNASTPSAPDEPTLRVSPAGSTSQPQPKADHKTSKQPQGQPLSQQAVEPEPEEARSTHGHSSAPKRARPLPGAAKIMPLEYSTCNPKDLGVLISNMLMELIRLNDRIPLRDGRLTRFHSRAAPGISVSDYLQRLIQHATLSPPILLSMVFYIDRLCAIYPAFTINSLTVHRFLITAATVAAKGLSDSFWTNPTYARIGGIPVSELATLELEFLQKVQWKIVPNPESLEEYYVSLVERTEGYELEKPPSVEVGNEGRDGSEGDGSSIGSDAMSTGEDGGKEADEVMNEGVP